MESASQICHTILVIEDDEAILFAIQQALEMEGYTVVTAKDGKAGLEMLQTLKKPCLILLDLMLPVMNGWEFLDRIVQEGGMLTAIPIVVTSAAGSGALTAAKRARGFIKKPIELDLLFSTVQKFCGSPLLSEG